MQEKKGIAILGSTGSIGTQALDVIEAYPDYFDLQVLTAGKNADLLIEQAKKFQPNSVVITDETQYQKVKEALWSEDIHVYAGQEALCQVVESKEVHTVLTALVGYAGLKPTIHAIEAGKTIALANKETLVVAGELITKLAQEKGVNIYPVDSEHSAIFQSLPEDASTWDARVEKIILTASGGPFRTRELSTLKDVTPEQACAHPNWVMGRKISVDSATMMNKALEVIEARYLFGLPPERLEVVIHPQSIIHSMVQYRDMSVVAQLGTPDMRVPIAYGLSWPERMASGAQALDFHALSAMTFEALDDHGHPERFAGIHLAWDALRGPRGTTAVLNAANEIAVAAFLDRCIRFDQIHVVNQSCMACLSPPAPHSLDDLLALDTQARAAAEDVVRRLAK